MRPRKFLLVTMAAVIALLWGSALVQATGQAANQAAGQPGATPQQNPSASPQNPVVPPGPTATETPDGNYPGSTRAQQTNGKEKHWSGSLVDVSCMAKELSAGSNPQQPAAATAPAGVPHFAAETSDPEPQAGQQRPGGGGMEPGQSNPNTTPTPNTATQGGTDMSQAQAAQMAKAERIDNAAKQCPPSSSTQMFGLSMPGGQVVQFDKDGDAKAAEALKELTIQPGKKVKAKVTGTLANTTMVKVASVEVKGKRASTAGPSGSGSGL